MRVWGFMVLPCVAWLFVAVMGPLLEPLLVATLPGMVGGAYVVLVFAAGARMVFGTKWTAAPLIHAPRGVVLSFLFFYRDWW